MNAQTLAAALLAAGTLTAGGLFAAADTPAPAAPPCAATGCPTKTACSAETACSGGGCEATREKAMARLTGRFNVQMKARDFGGALRTAKQAREAFPEKPGCQLMLFKARFAACLAAEAAADCPATCTGPGSDCCEATNCCESGSCCDGPTCCDTAADCPPAPLCLAATCDGAMPATAVAVCSATSEAAPPSPAVCPSVCSSPCAATCLTAAFECAPCEPADAIVRTAGACVCDVCLCDGGVCGEGGCPIPSKLRAVLMKASGTGLFAACGDGDTTCVRTAGCEEEEEEKRYVGAVAVGMSAAGPSLSVTCLDRQTGETLTGLKALTAVLKGKFAGSVPAACEDEPELARAGEPGLVKVERTYADTVTVEYEHVEAADFPLPVYVACGEGNDCGEVIRRDLRFIECGDEGGVAEAADCPCPAGCACPAPCGCGSVADTGIASCDAPCELPPPTPAGLYGLVQTASAAPAASVTPVSYAVAAPAGGLPVGSWSRTLNDQRVTLAVTADGSFRGTCTVPNGGCAIAFSGDCRCTADGLLFGAVTGARVVCRTGDSAADPVACVAAEGFCRTLIDQPFSARCRVTEFDGAPTMTVSHAMFGGIGFLGTPAPGEPAHLPLTMFSGAYGAE